MSFHGVTQVHLVERASRIALKWGITYDVERKVFRGPPYTVAAAERELEKWLKRKSQQQMLEERNSRW